MCQPCSENAERIKNINNNPAAHRISREYFPTSGDINKTRNSLFAENYEQVCHVGICSLSLHTPTRPSLSPLNPFGYLANSRLGRMRKSRR